MPSVRRQRPSHTAAREKGNDQSKVDFIFRIAGLEAIAPIREVNLTREWEIDYAKEHKIPVPVAKDKPWSIDENLWSRSIEGGRLEDPAIILRRRFYRPDRPA